MWVPYTIITILIILLFVLLKNKAQVIKIISAIFLSSGILIALTGIILIAIIKNNINFINTKALLDIIFRQFFITSFIFILSAVILYIVCIFLATNVRNKTSK